MLFNSQYNEIEPLCLAGSDRLVVCLLISLRLKAVTKTLIYCILVCRSSLEFGLKCLPLYTQVLQYLTFALFMYLTSKVIQAIVLVPCLQ